MNARMVLIEVALPDMAAQRESMVTRLTQSMDGARAEAGCLTYRFSVDLGNPLAFQLPKPWQDEAALVAHLQGQHFTEFVARPPALGRLTSSIARSGDLKPQHLPR